LAYLAKLNEAPEEYLDSWGLLDNADVSVFIDKLDNLWQHVEITLHTTDRKWGKPAFP
jgi:hypothetical protein